MSETKIFDREYIAPTYGRFDLELTRGEGSLVYGADGKEYIDLGTGIAVNTFGFCDGEWISAVSGQLSKLQHTSNLYYTEPQARLAKMLCEKTGMKKVFFSNSGAEANECMIKAARKWAHDTYSPERSTIITLESSFHGRTITTLAATGQDVFHTNFGPFPEGFVYARPGDLAQAEELLAKGVAAFMLETIQGEGGVRALGEEYIVGVYKLCKKYGALFCVDEVQTGNGRTGKLYSYMHYGITPDIVSTAKGLAGGLPMGATLFAESTANVLTAGLHGSTFGGNPVAAAGACSIISRIDDALLDSVSEKSAFIVSELSGAKGVKSVSGMGFMLGIETEAPAKAIVSKLMAKGVLVLTAKDRVRLLPALNIDFELLKKAVLIIKEVIADETPA
ncbi:MAG: acetylornithine/succinylornithine family transaminase [Clostridia bacterium]|nr:acetylornithine/succinylornithine family transaminase [Clostridia bacterium]